MRNQLIKSEVESVDGEHLTAHEYMGVEIDRLYNRMLEQRIELERMELKRKQDAQAFVYELMFESMRQRHLLYFPIRMPLGSKGRAKYKITNQTGLWKLYSPTGAIEPVAIKSIWHLEQIKSVLVGHGVTINWTTYQWLLNNWDKNNEPAH